MSRPVKTNNTRKLSDLRAKSTFWDPERIKQSENAVDLDKGEPVEGVSLEEPPTTIDDAFVPQIGVYETPAALKDLPLSPIMDDKEWKLWWNWVAKKDRTPHWDDLSKLEREVLKNPYGKFLHAPSIYSCAITKELTAAYALATPLRQDFVTKFRFPGFFLQRFTLYAHPEGGHPWFLPADLKTNIGPSRSFSQGRHTLATYENIRLLDDVKKKGRGDISWHAAKANFPRGEYIWREAMAAHVHQGLGTRLSYEMDDLPCRQCLVSAAKDEGSWQDKSVGCIIIWPGWVATKSKASKKLKPSSSEPIEHDLATNKPISRIKPVEIDDDGEVMTTTTLNTGIRVPCYFIGRMIGNHKAEELRQKLKIQKQVYRSALMVSVKSVNARVWLMKVAMYSKEAERVRMRVKSERETYLADQEESKKRTHTSAGGEAKSDERAPDISITTTNNILDDTQKDPFEDSIQLKKKKSKPTAPLQ